MKTKRSLSTLLGVILSGLAFQAQAVSITDSANYTVGQTIRDNDLNGLADTQAFSSSILNITSVEVRLTISGGYLGDLYAYVTHDSGFSVLLNRVGRGDATTDPYGSFANGLDVTFSSGSVNGDIHNAIGMPTGTWDPDGRNVDPLLVEQGSARNALLDQFNGLSAAGDWTLFVADVSAVGTATLDGWGLTVTGDGTAPPTVPDGGTSLVLVMLGAIGLLGFRRSMAG